jgi:imidazolonepropionase-like amidohydrolase
LKGKFGWLPRIAMLWLLAMSGGLVQAQQRTDRLALQNVTIIDLRDGALHVDQTVIWDRSRITTVGPSARVRVPSDTRVIDGTGRFVMPGLWDMHVHLWPNQTGDEPREDILPALIAHGVTAVRDMSDEDYLHSTVSFKKRWDTEARAGLRVGPRIVAAGSIAIDGPASLDGNGGRPTFIGVATPADARKLVRLLVDEGSADFIKMYSRIPRDSYFALMDEARHAGIRVAGHKPLAVSFIEAADAGQQSMEHAREILFDSFPGAAALQRSPAERNLSPTRLKEIVEKHDPRMLSEIFAAMTRNDAYYVPTHLTRLFDWKAAARDLAYLNDPRLRRLPEKVQASAREDVERTQARASAPGDAEVYRAFFEKGLQVTAQAHAAGVKVMAGTDSGDSYCFHGSSLHDELGWMVKAGMTPLAVLRAATVVPAEYVGRSKDFGAIEPGKLADMILLDRNPLADIGQTRSLYAVVFNGRLFDRAALEQLRR